MAYGTDQGLIDYLALTGRVLPVTTTADVARMWGSSYVNQFEDMYRGTATTTDASFPRDLWPVVPAAVEYATYEAAFGWATGVPLFSAGGTAGGQVTSEKVDTLAVTYAAPKDGEGWWDFNRYIYPPAYILLLPFFKRKGGFYAAALVV